MKKTIVLTSLVLGGVLFAGSQAMAQESKPLGLSLRAGGFFPSAGKARDLKDVWFGMGAEFKIKDLPDSSTDPAYSDSLAVSLDYFGADDARSLPLLLNYVGRKNEFFYSVGAGVGFNKDISGASFVTKNRFAYQVGIGYDFVKGTTPLFVEAKYFGFASGAKLNGLGLYLGVRF